MIKIVLFVFIGAVVITHVFLLILKRLRRKKYVKFYKEYYENKECDPLKLCEPRCLFDCLEECKKCGKIL